MAMNRFQKWGGTEQTFNFVVNFKKYSNGK
jgi:hypothetical protein